MAPILDWREGEELAVGQPLRIEVVSVDKNQTGQDVVAYRWRRIERPS